MLTREDMMSINNKLKGTGTKQHIYLKDVPNVITGENINHFVATEAPVAIVEEVEAPQYKIAMYVQEEPVQEQEIKAPIAIEEQEDELVIPYFVTPFYMECKREAEQQGTIVDAIAFEKLAKQLNITVRQAVRLVKEGLIEVRF